MRLSGLADRPIRWMVDDAAKFTAREVRRGRRYDGILLDPPKFGRGPGGEVWRLEENLAPLLADCRKLLDEDSRFLVLTVYAVRMSALAIGELVSRRWATSAGPWNAARWRSGRRRAGCCCRPRSSPAGLGTP
jgi:23S rRNA (cytosine1962-C5)-methyltransferase